PLPNKGRGNAAAPTQLLVWLNSEYGLSCATEGRKAGNIEKFHGAATRIFAALVKSQFPRSPFLRTWPGKPPRVSCIAAARKETHHLPRTNEQVALITFLVVLPVIFLSSFSCIAQDSELFRACNEKAKRQAEMNVCANDEAVRTDTELNTLSRTLLPKAGSQPEAVVKIQNAERAWIAHRNAYID